MAQLAIRGHKERGKEVIKILEMLGGKNKAYLQGTDTDLVYYIHSEDYIDTLYAASDKHYKVFTFEEFLEKFPYKIGDKVVVTASKDIFIDTIGEMKWEEKSNTILYVLQNIKVNVYPERLQFYKEEVMKEIADTSMAPILQSEDYSGRRFGYKIPKGYEFDCIKENEIIIKPIKPQYPKTYKECCKIMKIHPSYKLFGQATTQGEITNCVYVQNLLKNINILLKLITCRDAYWKIAGDWKPDWEKSEQPKFGLYTLKNEIRIINLFVPKNIILVFPTEEIRDIFYKNFKELIELCKELL